MIRVKAFTVLEIVLVMALTSILLSILFAVLQNFNKATSNDVKIKSELNLFFMMRSTIWKDLDQMDSVDVTQKDKLIIYHENSKIIYQPVEEGCERIMASGSYRFPFLLNETGCSGETNNRKLFFEFEWKNRLFRVSYPLKSSPSEAINTYFTRKEWQNK